MVLFVDKIMIIEINTIPFLIVRFGFKMHEPSGVEPGPKSQVVLAALLAPVTIILVHPPPRAASEAAAVAEVPIPTILVS